MPPKFPKYLYIAKEGTSKHAYYGAEDDTKKLVGYIDKNGNLDIAIYELVSVKHMQLEEK